MKPTATHPRPGGTRKKTRNIRASLCTVITAPARRAVSAAALVLAATLAAPAARGADIELVCVPGGAFVMGDASGKPDEAPRAVTVGPFRLMRFEVTKRQFTAFIAATGRPAVKRWSRP